MRCTSTILKSQFIWLQAGVGWSATPAPLVPGGLPLMDLPPLTLLQTNLLSPGLSIFLFSVDDNQDGVCDYTHIDAVAVYIVGPAGNGGIDNDDILELVNASIVEIGH